MSGYKEILKNLKPQLEVNKDLKISELQKDNAYLNIQLAKYKKLVAQPKKVEPKTKKEINSKMYKVAEQERRAKEKYKKEMVAKDTEFKFLRSRIKKKYGHQAYLDLVNVFDSPFSGIDVENYKKKHNL